MDEGSHYQHAPKIQQLFDDIEVLNGDIRNMETQIYQTHKLIESKYKLIHQLCRHKWVSKRENYMYGERYEECEKCGMFR